MLSLLATHKLHRLYVVNEAVEPIGLITLTDVLKLLCNEVRRSGLRVDNTPFLSQLFQHSFEIPL